MFWEIFKSVYLFVNIANFELYSVSFICGFDIVNGAKFTGKIHFCYLRVCSGSLADVRMRICHQNNGGSNISKRGINKHWREFFPNCAPAWGAADSNKVSFFLSIRVKIM